MQTARPGQFEYEVEAELLYVFKKGGSQFPAYGSIVASGANACCLHYRENNRKMLDGDLLLIDAGCELDGYASDITRTFPVNGKFSGPQKDIYEVVMASQDAAVAATRPGARFIDPHLAAVRVLTQGLIDLKLIEGPLDDAIELNRYSRFYMHRTGHWLGMDVHDCGEYREPGAKRRPRVRRSPGASCAPAWSPPSSRACTSAPPTMCPRSSTASASASRTTRWSPTAVAS